jgi:hypothetical protein
MTSRRKNLLQNGHDATWGQYYEFVKIMICQQYDSVTNYDFVNIVILLETNTYIPGRKKSLQLLTDGQGPILKAYPYRGICRNVGLSAVHERKKNRRVGPDYVGSDFRHTLGTGFLGLENLTQ